MQILRLHSQFPFKDNILLKMKNNKLKKSLFIIFFIIANINETE